MSRVVFISSVIGFVVAGALAFLQRNEVEWSPAQSVCLVLTLVSAALAAITFPKPKPKRD